MSQVVDQPAVQAELPSEPSPEPAPKEPKPKSGLGWLIGGGLLLLSKFKSVLALVKLLPAGKFLLTSASMFAMIAFEAQRSGWIFGVGFVLLILIHELGHGYAMRRAGVDAGWPVFIPFFGAMIAMKGLPRSRSVEADIAFGGPLAGTAASLLCAGAGLLFSSKLLLALSSTGFFLNLFNLAPMSPLDGGRVAQAFSPRAWIAGLIILGGLFLITPSPQLILIGVLGLSQLLRKNADDRDQLAASEQRAWAVRYFGLCAFLTVAFFLNSRVLGRG